MIGDHAEPDTAPRGRVPAVAGPQEPSRTAPGVRLSLCHAPAGRTGRRHGRAGWAGHWDRHGDRHGGKVGIAAGQNDGIGAAFGLPAAPSLRVVPARVAPFTATRLDLRGAGDGLTRVALPARDSWFLMLYLAPAMHADILAGGARLPLRTYPAGSICLVDLRRGAAIAIRGRLQALALGLPRDLLAEIADMGAGPGRPRPTGLRCLRGVPDPVIASLSRALLPLFLGNHMVKNASCLVQTEHVAEHGRVITHGA